MANLRIRYDVTDIEWDIDEYDDDDEVVEAELPSETVVSLIIDEEDCESDLFVSSRICDELSDEYGYCVEDFCFVELDRNKC